MVVEVLTYPFFNLGATMEKLLAKIGINKVILSIILSLIPLIAWAGVIGYITKNTESKFEEHLKEQKIELKSSADLMIKIAVLETEVNILLPAVRELTKELKELKDVRVTADVNRSKLRGGHPYSAQDPQ
jgi:hypothetical protein